MGGRKRKDSYYIISIATSGAKMYLSKVRIQNFRCLDSVELELKPITLIYGLNGAGKSSVLAAIQLLKQSMGYDRLMTTEILNVGSFENFVRDLDETRWVTIGLEISFYKNEFPNRLVFSDINRYIQRFDKVKFPIKKTEYEVSFRMNNGFLELKQTVKLNETPLLATISLREKGAVRERILIPEIKATPNTPRHFLHENLGYFNFPRPTEEQNDMRKLYGDLMRDIIRMFRDVLNNYFVIGPTRGTKSFETQTPTDPKWVGYEGEDVTGLLSRIWGNAALSQKRLKISRWAEIFGLFDLWAGFQGGNKLGVTFRDPESGTPVNLNWAGHGSKQMLILITQMFHGDEGAIIALEEPEISLHLALQTQLPELFSEVVKEKKQIIVTTHSSQFLTAFRQSFKNHTLTTNDLAVHHLEKTQKGATSKKLKVTRQGIVKPFPPSIAKAEKKLISQAFK